MRGLVKDIAADGALLSCTQNEQCSLERSPGEAQGGVLNHLKCNPRRNR